MRVRLVQNLLHGGFREAGSLIDNDDDEWCEQLVERGLAVVVEAAAVDPVVVNWTDASGSHSVTLSGAHEAAAEAWSEVAEIASAVNAAPIAAAPPPPAPDTRTHRKARHGR